MSNNNSLGTDKINYLKAHLHYHAKRLLRLRDDALRAVREADESAAVPPPDGTPLS